MKLQTLIFFVLLSPGYAWAQDNKFDISVQGIPEGGIAILSYRNTDFDVKTDTVKAQGQPSQFSGFILEPVLASIQFRDSAGKQLKYQNFFLSPGKTAIAFDAVKKSTTIQGGPEQIVYTKLNSDLLAAKNSFAGGHMVALVNDIRAKRRKGIPDSLFRKESIEYDSLWQLWEHEEEKLQKQFIRNNPHSLVSVTSIGNFVRSAEDNEIAELYNGLSDQVKQSRAGMQINRIITAKNNGKVGVTAPNFYQTDPDGNIISLADYRGKYVLVDFWASWCIPCREENPNLRAAYEQYQDKGFEILGISLDDDKEKWLKAIASDGLNWKQVSDLQGWKNKVSEQFGIYSIPQNILVDPSGMIVANNLRGKELNSKLEELLGTE